MIQNRDPKMSQNGDPKSGLNAYSSISSIWIWRIQKSWTHVLLLGPSILWDQFFVGLVIFWGSYFFWGRDFRRGPQALRRGAIANFDIETYIILMIFVAVGRVLPLLAVNSPSTWGRLNGDKESSISVDEASQY